KVSPFTSDALYSAVISEEVCSKFSFGGNKIFGVANHNGSFLPALFLLSICCTSSCTETFSNGLPAKASFEKSPSKFCIKSWTSLFKRAVFNTYQRFRVRRFTILYSERNSFAITFKVV